MTSHMGGWQVGSVCATSLIKPKGMEKVVFASKSRQSGIEPIHFYRSRLSLEPNGTVLGTGCTVQLKVWSWNISGLGTALGTVMEDFICPFKTCLSITSRPFKAGLGDGIETSIYGS